MDNNYGIVITNRLIVEVILCYMLFVTNYHIGFKHRDVVFFLDVDQKNVI